MKKISNFEEKKLTKKLGKSELKINDDVDDEDDDDDEDSVAKGGEGRTTESIRTGLKDARVVKGLGDKVTMMKR